MRRIIYVEDTYGVGFHRGLLEKLRGAGLLSSDLNPRFERLPAGKCNRALQRKVLAKIVELGAAALKAVFVVDSEGDPEAGRAAILRHFGNPPPGVSVRVVAVDPRHEAWLCIGLGGSRSGCRGDPEEVLHRLRGVRYDKERLGEWVTDVDIGRLLGEPDFRDYLDSLRWLSEDP